MSGDGNSASDPFPETITECARALQNGSVTAAQLVEQAIESADALDEELGIYISRFDDLARERAHDIDSRRARGEDVGALGGIPIAVKDLIATLDGPTTGGSLVDYRSWSEPQDGAAMRRLREAGAIVMGKSSTSELGMGTPDPSKPFPRTRNPWDVSRWSGGSSAGSACAVATRTVLGGLGTDSGGSIRQPSAFCGISGLKPSYGRVPKDACVPMGWSTDHVGPMTTSAGDCALLLQVMAGHDCADPTSARVEVPRFLDLERTDPTGLRVGVDPMARIGGGRADPSQPQLFEDAVTRLASLGCDIREVELPHYELLTAAAMVTTLSEALAYHSDDFAKRWGDFFANTRKTMGLGAYFTGADYVQAQRVRRMVIAEVRELFRSVDLIAMPTASIVAPRHEDLGRFVADGDFFAVYSTYWNMTGNPSLTVPIGFNHEGLPLGMQLVGDVFDEQTALRAGFAYQTRTDWHKRRPSRTQR